MIRKTRDIVVYNDIIFFIENLPQNDVLTPDNFGMTATPVSFNDARGYYAKYQIENQQIFLTDFSVSLANEYGYTQIDGKDPIFDSLGRKWLYHYSGLKVEVNLNGKLLVGHKFSWSGFYFNSYKTIKSLHFKAGQLIDEVDYSRFGRYMRFRYRLAKLFRTYDMSDMRKHYNMIRTKIPLDDYGYEGVYERVFEEYFKDN